MPLTESDIPIVMAAGVTPRMKRLEQARGYVTGAVYDDRPDFFDNSVPLRGRRPCVLYHAVRNAAKSYSTLCLGLGKFPQITSGTSENDSTFDDRFGLNEADSKKLDAGVKKIEEQTRFAAVAQQVFESELWAGTSVTVVAVVKGRLRVTQLNAKHCTPTFAIDDPEVVTQLEVKYRYTTDDTWSQGEGKYVRRVWVYRRVIDDTFDITFEPVEITRQNDNPVPDQPAKGGKFRHGFGFCPVHWRRANVDLCDEQELDGRPIHWGLYSLIDAINLGLSQRFRAALYTGDPQLVETGVTEDEVLVPIGRASDALQPNVDVSGWREPLSSAKMSGRMSEKKRKSGAGTVWRYESAEADVRLLTLPAGALDAISEDVADNIKNLREALGHVYIDPETLTGSGDISGKTLAFLYAQQIARCNQMREDFGRGWILPVLNMLFRVVLASGKGLYLAGADKLAAVLKRYEQKVGTDASVTWFPPSLKLAWGDYFPPSDLDEATRLRAAIDALNGNLITRTTAVLHIQSIFPDIQNVDQYVEALEQAVKDKLAAMSSAMGALSASTDDDEPIPPKPVRKKKPAVKKDASAADGAADTGAS